MTTGQLLFYGGAALLGLTILLVIIFIIKKPKYTPESAAYDGANPGKTHSLRNGYPTDRMTVRREPAQPAATDIIKQSQETELLTETLTEPLSGMERLQQTEVMDSQQTEALTEPLSGTEQLQGTEVLEPQQTATLTEE